MPDDLQKLVNRELESRESVIWSAQPGLRRFVIQGVARAAFGVVWTNLILYFASNVVGNRAFHETDTSNVLMLAFLIPFFVIGLGLMSGPYWAIRAARHTAYVLTDRRVLIIEHPFWSTTVRSYTQLGRMFRREKSGGSGDIILDEIAERDSDKVSSVKEIGLFGVPKVREVEQLIKDTLAKAAAESATPTNR